MERIEAARELFLKEGFGVLSTISVDVPGYPFGSVTPYCTDAESRPVLYISHIAQHTRNILADPRVSLTIVENGNASDVQAQGRLTYIANARPVEAVDSRTRERYFRYFPAARRYDQTHDFAFFRLEPVRLRFIGGFGQIYWVDGAEFSSPNPFSDAEESRIVAHMNNDHHEALRHYAGADAVMTGIDSAGFDLLSQDKKQRVRFDTPVHNMDEARQQLVAMARR